MNQWEGIRELGAKGLPNSGLYSEVGRNGREIFSDIFAERMGKHNRGIRGVKQAHVGDR